MFRKVMLTLDGSSYSEAAVPQAIGLFKGTDCTVHLVRVYDEPPSTSAAPVKEPLTVSVPAPGGVVTINAAPTVESTAQATARVAEEGRRFLARKAAPLEEAGISHEIAVRFGAAAEEIVRYAGDNRMELVIMATHGHTGLARLIFGGVASKVLASGICPVLLVRPEGLKGE
jgi:nucleotide-binding universal stress UspA family protein